MRLLIAVLLIAAPLRAGVVYDFATTVETMWSRSSQSGHMTVAGEKYRAEVGTPGKRTVVISRDGDRTAIVFDPAKNTWQYRTRIGDVRSSLLFHLIAGAKSSVIGSPVVEHHIAGTERVAGFDATKHVIDIRYRLVGMSGDIVLRGEVKTRATVWTVDSLPALPLQRQLRTGHQVVDALIDNVSRELRGMVVRHELEVTRTYDGGGRPQTERTVTTVDNVQIVDVADSAFALPESAMYHSAH